MKSAKSYRKLILGILILLLAVIYALQLVFTGKSRQQTLTLKESPDRLLITSSANGSISLTKEDGSWYLGEDKYKADDSVVQRLLDSIVNVKILGTASSSVQGEEDRYGLAQGQAVEVQAYSGDKLLRSMRIGKATATGGQTFVQLNSKAQVYLLGEALDGLYTKTADELRDINVYDFADADIVTVSLSDDESLVSFTKSFAAPETGDADSSGPAAPGVVWNLTAGKLPEGAALDSDKITGWVNGLNFLRCSKWMDKNYLLPEGSRLVKTVGMKASDGNEISVTVYETKAEEKKVDEEENESTLPAEYVFKSSASPYFFTLSSSSQGKFNKEISDLLKE